MSEKGEERGDVVRDMKRESPVDGSSSPKRIKLGDKNDSKKITRDSLLSKFKEQDGYIDYLESKVKQSSNSGEVTLLRESEEKLKLQQQESTRRENVLVMRLATKEQEMQELLTQIHDLKQAHNPAGAQLRSTLLDPAVNIVFQRMKTELDETKEKLEQAQNDLSAWKFTPDSVTGKKLMAKCRMLIQENQELGRQLSQGRVAQLEAELALQKKYSEELKTSQDELNEFVIQLDEEVEGMQSTILALQKQLKGVKSQLVEEKENGEKQIEQIRVLEKNLDEARTQPPSPVAPADKPQSPVVALTMQCEPEAPMVHSEPEAPMVHSEPEKPMVHGEPVVNSEAETPVVHRKPEIPMINSEPESPNMQWEPETKENEPQEKNKETRTEGANDDAIHTNPSVHHVGNEERSMTTPNMPLAPQEEPVVKIAPTPAPPLTVSTPPGSTTFSISQILGEPKKTLPVSDSVLQGSAGGDAVVTKLPYLGGLKDPSITAGNNALGGLRTDETVVANGGEEGIQPVVT